MEFFKIIAPPPQPPCHLLFFYPLPVKLKIDTSFFHLIVYNDIEN